VRAIAVLAALALGGSLAASGTVAAHVAPAVLATGASGSSGASGTSGTSGSSGTSGASGASGSSGATGSTRTRLVKAPPAIVADAVNGVEIELNGAPDPSGPTPALHPSVAGTWSIVGDYEKFTPTTTLAPCGRYVLAVSGRTLVSGDKTLGKRRAFAFSVQCPSVTGTAGGAGTAQLPALQARVALGSQPQRSADDDARRAARLRPAARLSPRRLPRRAAAEARNLGVVPE
jgi:hypothetical protein